MEGFPEPNSLVIGDLNTSTIYPNSNPIRSIVHLLWLGLWVDSCLLHVLYTSA
jgi:hypothetical protein